MNTCFEVAHYFILCSNDDTAGEPMTNLKLQKLVYYAQGSYLAIHRTPLFEEHIEAWEHGPVCPVLWRAYKGYGSNPLPLPEVDALEPFDEKARIVLRMVWEYYGQFSAWKLRNFTHSEPPWLNAYQKGWGIISHQSMIDYFETQIEEDDET